MISIFTKIKFRVKAVTILLATGKLGYRAHLRKIKDSSKNRSGEQAECTLVLKHALFRYTTTKFSIFIGSICIICAILYMFVIKPPIYEDLSFSRIILDRNNKLMRISLTKDDKYRLYTPLSKISTKLQKAVLLYEDKGFYQHFGVDPCSLLNAFVKTYLYQLQ